MPDDIVSQAERLERAIERIASTLADEFQPSDLAILLREAAEVAETLTDLSGPHKRQIAERLFGELVKRVRPKIKAWIEKRLAEEDNIGPDAIMDPLLALAAMTALDHLLPALSGGLLDLVVAASKGELKLNAPG